MHNIQTDTWVGTEKATTLLPQAEVSPTAASVEPGKEILGICVSDLFMQELFVFILRFHLNVCV